MRHQDSNGGQPRPYVNRLGLVTFAAVAALGVGVAASANADEQPTRNRAVNTPDAPAAIGPYSQGITTGRVLYVSGQLALDPHSGEMVGNDVATQTRRSLQNVEAIVEEAGMSLDEVVSTTVYVQDLDDYSRFNEVYADFFDSPAPPARATVEVARLPRDALVEISAIVVR